MPAPRGNKVVELLISEAREANLEGRYSQALAAAERAELAAEGLRDPGLVISALYQQEWALRLLGDLRTALVVCTRMLRMAEDPRTRDKLADSQAARAICKAYQDFVCAARQLPGAQPDKLLGVLDEADRWLTATGRSDWRGGILLQRAEVYSILGDKQQAVDLAQEALAAHRKGSAGDSLGYHHNCLGRCLLDADRPAEAVTHFQAVLDDPQSQPYDRMLAHRSLADRALASDESDDAVRHANAAVRLGESCGNNAASLALGMRGRVYQKVKRCDEALADLDRAVELSPEEVWVIGQRAYLHGMLERYDEALADLGRILELDPAYAWALAYRGYVRGQMGRNEEALADLDRALKLNFEDAWAVTQRDKIRQSMGGNN